MKLVLRRARAARGLLLAAGAAALVATAMVTGLSDYNRQAVAAGQRAVLRAATAEEASLLVTGDAGADRAEYLRRDQGVRAQFAAGLGGAPTTTTVARYGTGRQLGGEVGARVASGNEPVFAALGTLDELSTHADLTSGTWAQAGATPLQVSLPEEVAARLGLTVGSQVPLIDRRTGKSSPVQVTGLWRPRNPAEPYWRLAPGIGADSAPSDTSYGPFVLHPDDFERTFPSGVSASWVVVPDLDTIDPSRLGQVRTALATVTAAIPQATGLGSSAQSASHLDRLTDRIARADLVGRSALFTPLMLIMVLAGYALILIAALLHEDRRTQTALLRARGAARRQLAGFAAQEATLVVLPAALAAPLLAGQVLQHTDVTGAGATVTAFTWLVAVGVAAGCLLAMLGPALRRGDTYVADLAARSRPNRFAAAQRIGLDLALVALAVLAWFQLRQYASPLAGAGSSLGVDPLLAAAPTLGVLAGAVVALRLLPPGTRFAERFVDPRPWVATMIGMWQAGRRPHAGPVLLLALAVGGSTLSWSLVSTWEHSQVDQANHEVGADLRLVERAGAAPADRAAQLAALPGVGQLLPGWRDDIRIGRSNAAATVIALDAAQATPVVQLADRLTDDTPAASFAKLAEGRPEPVGVPMGAGARRLTGTLQTRVLGSLYFPQAMVSALVTTADGLAWSLPLPVARTTGEPVPFDLALPDAAGRELRFAGFVLDAGPVVGRFYDLVVTGLSTTGPDGAHHAVNLTAGGTWVARDGETRSPATATITGDRFTVRYVPNVQTHPFITPYARFALVQMQPQRAVPALVTPQVLDELGAGVGDVLPLQLSGATIRVRAVGLLDAVPATGTEAAILIDLPSAVNSLVTERGTVRPIPEWWVSVQPGRHDEVARTVALPGLEVIDRQAVTRAAATDPYWRGARTGLVAAALGAILLALVGLAVDVWATARQRVGELAVLHTLGATPRLLARALLAEQTFLAGMGVTVGVLVGAGVAATMAPLVILTRTAGRPVPAAEFQLPWLAIAATAVGLLLAALTFSGLVAAGMRQRVAATQLRIGGDR